MSLTRSPAAPPAPRSAPHPDAPTPRDVALALGGLLALGAASVAGGGLSTVADAPAALLVQAGGLLLAAPALLVTHQLLGLRAAPGALVFAVGRGLVRAGHLALGLAPSMLFFSATTRCAGLLLALVLGLVSAATLAAAWRDLVDAERAALGPNPGARDWPMRGLALAWCALAGLVAVRLAFVSFPPLFS
jgi:hypothetical protein